MDQLPLDVMRQIAAENVESWLPTAPNVTRYRYSGGTKNKHGELVGAAEETAQLRALVVQKRERREQRAGGDAVRVQWVADYLATDNVIEPGDELRALGRRFVVVGIDPPELDGVIAFLRARLEEIKT